MTPRILTLLNKLSKAQTDLQNAETKALADCAQSDISSIRHSLFLAGHQFEGEDA